MSRSSSEDVCFLIILLAKYVTGGILFMENLFKRIDLPVLQSAGKGLPPIGRSRTR
uniref:Uncharacterized protein n=1 Tax=Arundo donax TaxID=35708 RepID=A0A0A9T212_ARUDO